MRIILDLKDELLQQAKGKAAERGSHQLDWHVEHGRMMPGVRLDDRDALFDLMDGLR